MAQKDSIGQIRSRTLNNLLSVYESLASVKDLRISLLIFIVALLVRTLYIAFLVGFNSAPIYDGIRYDRYAVNILTGKGFSDLYGPTAFRPPLYPLFLTFTYFCFGHSYVAVRVIQTIIGSLTCIVMYWLGLRLFDKRVGLLASLAACFHPLLLYMTGEFYSEVLLLLLVTVMLLFSTRIIKQGGRREGFFTGTWLGLSILARSGTILLIPFSFLWLLLQKDSFAKRIEMVISLLLAVVLVITPWVLRNYVVFQAFIPLATEGGVTLWAGNNPLTNGAGIKPNKDSWQGEDFPDLGWHGWSTLGEVDSDQKFFNTALTWIKENPLKFLSLMPKKLMRLWSPTSYVNVSDRNADSRLTKVICIPYSLFMFFALIGFASTWKDFQRLFLLYSLIFYTNLSAAITMGGTRFSVPMLPSLILLASVGVNAVCHYLYSRLSGGVGRWW